MLSDLLKQIKNVITNWLSFVIILPILFKVKKGDVVVDCGANVGYVTGLLASRGARVWSFEPDPNAFAVLKKKFQNTHNVTCLNKGVWSENSTMKLYFHKGNNDNKVPWTVSSSLIAKKRNVSSEHFKEVELVDFSEFVRGLNEQVKLVKMDIEGAEIKVLNRLIDSGQAEKIDLMIVETHETKIPGQEEELEALKEKIEKAGLSNIKLNWL